MRRGIRTLGMSILLVLALAVGCGQEKNQGEEPTVSLDASVTEAVTEGVTPEATATPTATTAPVTPTKVPTITTVPAADRTGPAVSISRASGVYAEAFDVALTTEGDAVIYYTLDGSDPLISDTAICYGEAIVVDSRENDSNVVSAVDPVLISGNFNEVNRAKNGFTCKISAPTDDAVDKCTVLRAVAKTANGEVGAEVSATYFIGTMEGHIDGLAETCAAMGQELAVISIQMNYGDLFDSTFGIYVKGDIFDAALKEYLKTNRLRDAETARSLDANYKQKGRAWERLASVTLFECDTDGATAVLNQLCGIRVQGNYSRSDLQKGLRLYARTEYGDNNFRYAVFGEEYVNDAGEVMDKFKTLVLRAGGNYAFSAKFNDLYWQTLVEDSACETKKGRPCVVYLNGEYWGLYILEEDYTDDYMEDVHGVPKEEVVIYKGDAEALELGYKLDEGDLPEGVTDESYYYGDLLRFFETHSDAASQEDYQELCSLVDPVSVMDYFAVQIWGNNKWDWPGKNWSMWKTKTVVDDEYGDGRWRFLFYDMEFCGCMGENGAKTNTIKEDNYRPNGLLDMDTGNPAVLCFAYLMTNEGFRQAFYERLSGLSEGQLSQERALEVLAQFEAIYSPLYRQFDSRYQGCDTLNQAGWSIGSIRDFLEIRKNYIQKMINYCEQVLR